LWCKILYSPLSPGFPAAHLHFSDSVMLSSLSMNGNSLFLYTEEKRGKQLVESTVVGQVTDYSGRDKMIAVKDPHANLNFLYRIDHASGNLDAVAILYIEDSSFNGKQTLPLGGQTYKLGRPEDAMLLLKGRAHWIQDKGSVLAVLVQGAARKNAMVNHRISRERVTEIPHGITTEYLPSADALLNDAFAPPAGEAAPRAPENASSGPGKTFG
jgi:hypothetical protein